MITIATKQPTNDSVKQKKKGNRGQSRSVFPLSTGMPLLQRKCACGGGCPRCKEELGIQTKLKIGEPGDKYEQEANRVVDQIRMSELKLQRQVDEREKEELLKKAAGNSSSVPLDTVLPGSFKGSPIGSAPVFFNSTLARIKNALALTHQHKIHVSPLASRFHKSKLQQLLAHEGVHLAQQRGGSLKGHVAQLEAEADQQSSQVLANRVVNPRFSASPSTYLLQPISPTTQPQEYHTPESIPREIGENQFDQAFWVSRIDRILRDRFQLSSRRAQITLGRVQFQSPNIFGTGFSQQDLREHLINLFLTTDLGERETIFRIIRFHGFAGPSLSHPEVEQIVDQGLQAREFLYWNHRAIPPYSQYERIPGRPDRAIAIIMSMPPPFERREVAFQDVVNRITPQALLTEYLAGITSGSRLGHRQIRIRASASSPAALSTLIHEGCHFYRSNAFEALTQSARSQQLTVRRSQGGIPQPAWLILQEGFTEFFTRVIMREYESALGSNLVNAYERELEAARIIIENMGQQAAEQAYFHGSATAIQHIRTTITFINDNPSLAEIIAQGRSIRELEASLREIP